MFDFEEYNSLITEYSVEDARQELNNVVAWFREQEWHQNAMEACIVNGRLLPLTVADEADCFFVPETLLPYELPEWMQAPALGIVKFGSITQAGRLVYPVKDVKGDVMGFCGWDKFVDPKYLDSKNYGYKAKATTLYGMEKLPEYYESNKPVYVTEGIVCCLWLRSQGFQALALLGSNMTHYVIEILKRFGSRLVMVPDNDQTGDSFIRKIKWNLKKAIIVQAAFGKDLDGCRKFEDCKYEKELVKELLSLTNPFVKTRLLIRR